MGTTSAPAATDVHSVVRDVDLHGFLR